jgi:hypothetical protein
MTPGARRRWLAGLIGLGLAVAACDRQEAAEAATESPERQIACQPSGAADFVICAIDRSKEAQGMVLTLHNPDGGFHRLLVTKDGRGVVAADGAEPAIVRVVGEREIEVAIGGDRYRLPATVAANGVKP